MPNETLVPDWPAPAGVQARVTLRAPGTDPYGRGNVATHVGDDPRWVAARRARLAAALGGIRLAWLDQVHGTAVVEVGSGSEQSEPVADAAWTRARGVACAILTADCVPVLLCDRDGACVGAAHCGWRGLADGVLTALIAALPVAAGRLIAWIGPGVGAVRYEVGPEVVARFAARWGEAALRAGFRFPGRGDRALADLASLARFELRALGVRDIHGGDFCTARDPRFYSHRRDGVTGRMASLVWRE
jgi:YfiH family protein